MATSLLDRGDHAVVVRTNYATNLETHSLIYLALIPFGVLGYARIRRQRGAASMWARRWLGLPAAVRRRSANDSFMAAMGSEVAVKNNVW